MEGREVDGYEVGVRGGGSTFDLSLEGYFSFLFSSGCSLQSTLSRTHEPVALFFAGQMMVQGWVDGWWCGMKEICGSESFTSICVEQLR